MNITLLATDIASRINEMSRDSSLNNAQLIESLIRQEMKRGTKKKPKFVLLEDQHASNTCFIYALDRAIKFHTHNPNDPHKVGNAVIAALTEVRDCFKAYT
jgi:hypothetical protein